MKNLIHLALALMILVGNRCPVISAPTHKPISKADEAQHYTAGLSLRGSIWGDGLKMRLTLAGHTATSNVSLNGWMGLQATDLRPGVYTATATFLGLPKRDMYGHETVDTTPSGNVFDFQSLQVYSTNGLIKLISVGNVSPPPGYMAVGGATTSIVWGWGSNYQEEMPQTQVWLAHHTINHIGDTCKIVFYVGPYNSAFSVKKFIEASSKQARSKTIGNGLKIDFDFISRLEGKQKLTAYTLPASYSKSGVTVATGIDLGQLGRDEIKRLNISASLKEKLLPYAFPLHGQAAINFRNQHPLSLSQGEANALDKAFREYKINLLPQKYDAATASTKFKDLPGDAQTAIAAVAYQYGGDLAKPKAAPKFWADVTRQKWNTAIAELHNFHDGPVLQKRHDQEAALLQRAVGSGALK